MKKSINIKMDCDSTNINSEEDIQVNKPLKIQNASIKKYKLLKTIGKGYYSKYTSIFFYIIYRVKLAKSIESQKFYAIKIIKRHEVEKIDLSAFKRILANEVQLLQSMDHPNIIKLVEYNCEGEVLIKPSGKAI